MFITFATHELKYESVPIQILSTVSGHPHDSVDFSNLIDDREFKGKQSMEICRALTQALEVIKP